MIRQWFIVRIPVYWTICSAEQMADSNIQSTISVLRFLLSVLLSLLDERIAGRRVFFLLKQFG